MDQKEINLSHCDLVAVLDPARSRESEYKVLSRHAIVVTAMDFQENIFVLFTWAKRTDLNELLLVAEETCRLFPTLRCFGVETVAAQIVIKDVISEWLRLNRIMVPTVDLRPDTRITKKWRIRMQIQRPATRGKLFLQGTHHELRTELLGFPHSRTIDLVDALAYCIGLHYPPEDMQETISYPKSTLSIIEKMRQDGRIREIPNKQQSNQFPYENLPELKPRLAPTLADIFPKRGEDL